MPKRYVVEISAHAQRDVIGIRDHIGADNPRAAQKWLAALGRQHRLLGQFPLRGAVIPEAERLGVQYRHLLHGSYRTIYRIAGKRVIVVRVIHGGQLLAND